MHGVGIGVTKCHEREMIRTHRKKRAGFLQDPDVSGVEVWELVVELRGIGEIHKRENVLEARTRLKQYYRAVWTRSFDHIKHSNSMNSFRRVGHQRKGQPTWALKRTSPTSRLSVWEIDVHSVES